MQVTQDVFYAFIWANALKDVAIMIVFAVILLYIE